MHMFSCFLLLSSTNGTYYFPKLKQGFNLLPQYPNLHARLRIPNLLFHCFIYLGVSIKI